MSNNTLIKTLFSEIKSLVKMTFPKWQANKLYRQHFKRNINWKHPTEFNEKIRWMQFHADTSKWSLLADKYRVREYLQRLGYGHLLVRLYGVWDKASDIDFDKLPDSFVLKTKHGYGSVFVIKDKHKADLENIRKQLTQDLSEKFGIETAEQHYLRIKPVIVAEELLKQTGEISTSLIDYKFYCINGEPQFCGVMYNRSIKNHTYDVRLYDNNWDDISHLLASHTHQGQPIPRPHTFEDMKLFCRKVCKEFPFIRMDFYECDGKLYFGEFTFTPAACTGGSLSLQAQELLANKIKLYNSK